MAEIGVATKAIIQNTQTKKYLVLFKSNQEDINPNTYDFPGGRIRFGENLEEAVVREAQEETGLKVNPVTFFNAWTFTKRDRDFQLVGIDFLCTTEQENIILSEEHSDYEWLNADQIIGDEKYPEWLRKTIQKAKQLTF